MIKVILVEDNFFLQKALEEKLSNFSDIVIKDTAQNGEEAIAILEKNHVVDLILMDIEMPVMNGIKATEIIKSKYPQIKIVMITVFDNDDNVFNAIKAGADGPKIDKDCLGNKAPKFVKLKNDATSCLIKTRT